MRPLLLGGLAMAVIVAASNILVQYPLGGWLTWGALTYPFAFLVTDLANRTRGPSFARRVVVLGFLTGILCSVIGAMIDGPNGPLVTFRIALASGTAFLAAQLLDVTVFDRLRAGTWWKAPFVSTLVSSSLDTLVFFGLAFSMAFVWIEPGNDVSWAAEPTPLLGVGPVLPYWMSLAVADWGVKILLAIVALVPFRLALARMTTKVA